MDNIDKNIWQESVDFKFSFNKKHEVIMYSGTLALEAALRIAGFGNGERILINNLACYSVLQAIINAGCIPVLMQPSEFQVVLDEPKVIDSIGKYDIKGFIAIHQFGIYQEIEQIKLFYPDIIIIEDASQAWGIVSPNNINHQFSDYIVLSLGKTKPLGLGIGGVLLTDNNLIYEMIDTKDRNSRYKNNRLILYMMPSDFAINIPLLINYANHRINVQKQKAQYYELLFKNNSLIRVIEEKDGYQYSWHRYPIFLDPYNESYLQELLTSRNIRFQKNFTKSLNQLEVANDFIYIGEKGRSITYLLRTQ